MRIAVLILSALLTGCVTTPSQDLTPTQKVALQEVSGIAVRRYLREHPNQTERIQRFRLIAAQIQSATTVTTIAGLRDVAVAEINKRLTDPLDKADAISLVNILAALIQERVGTGELDLAGLVQVREVIGFIVAALPPA